MKYKSCFGIYFQINLLVTFIGGFLFQSFAALELCLELLFVTQNICLSRKFCYFVVDRKFLQN